MSDLIGNHIKSYDVAVVGSGPAGSTSALYLAKKGLRVAIIEKEYLPRHKTCGGGVIQRALRLVKVDVSGAIERQCHTVHLVLQTPRLNFFVKRNTPIISMASRRKFDYILLTAAEDAGTDVYQGCRVTNVMPSAGRVKLLTTKGAIDARFVVAADGAMSTVARKTGWKEDRQLIPAIECDISPDDEFLERVGKTARFDFGVVPSGYGWLFPKRGHVSIGVMSLRQSPLNLNRIFEVYLRNMGLEEALGAKRRGWVIPLSPRRDSFVKGRVLLTGDAAGLADPFTGEGISLAILSGNMAASAIIAGRLDENQVKQHYELMISRRILSELRLGRCLAGLAYRSPKAFNMALRLNGQRLIEAATDVAMGISSYRRLLYNPVNYLKLLIPWGISRRN